MTARRPLIVFGTGDGTAAVLVRWLQSSTDVGASLRPAEDIGYLVTEPPPSPLDLVTVIRDGRDAVREDWAGLSFGDRLTRWVADARQVLAIRGRPLWPGVHLRTVRYEDLRTSPTATLAALCAWAGLDVRDAQAPVLEADPHAPWRAHQRARFRLRGGVEQLALGYGLPPVARQGWGQALAIEVAATTARRARRVFGTAR